MLMAHCCRRLTGMEMLIINEQRGFTMPLANNFQLFSCAVPPEALFHFAFDEKHHRYKFTLSAIV